MGVVLCDVLWELCVDEAGGVLGSPYSVELGVALEEVLDVVETVDDVVDVLEVVEVVVDDVVDAMVEVVVQDDVVIVAVAYDGTTVTVLVSSPSIAITETTVVGTALVIVSSAVRVT